MSSPDTIAVCSTGTVQMDALREEMRARGKILEEARLKDCGEEVTSKSPKHLSFGDEKNTSDVFALQEVKETGNSRSSNSFNHKLLEKLVVSRPAYLPANHRPSLSGGLSSSRKSNQPEHALQTVSPTATSPYYWSSCGDPFSPAGDYPESLSATSARSPAMAAATMIRRSTISYHFFPRSKQPPIRTDTPSSPASTDMSPPPLGLLLPPHRRVDGPGPPPAPDLIAAASPVHPRLRLDTRPARPVPALPPLPRPPNASGARGAATWRGPAGAAVPGSPRGPARRRRKAAAPPSTAPLPAAGPTSARIPPARPAVGSWGASEPGPPALSKSVPAAGRDGWRAGGGMWSLG
jgi:hypothetical protein